MRWRLILLWTSLAVFGCLRGFDLRGQMIGGEAARQAAPEAARAQQRSLGFVIRRGVRPGQRGASAARYAAALAQRQVAAQQHLASTPEAWTEVGPLQVGTPAYGLVTGRVTSLAADPSGTGGNTLYVGTTGGGVWKSTNAAGSGATFHPVTDTVAAFTPPAAASLSVGAITVQPGGTGVLLAGTGDPNDATDSYYGVGILRSTDGGQSWSVITTADLQSAGSEETFLGNAFAGFAWSSSSPNLVVAAVTDSPVGAQTGENGATGNSMLGLYYSEDAGATWSLATLRDGSQVIEANLPGSGEGNAVTSVVWNPVRQRFYAAIRYHGYYESTDGANWTRLANQPGTNFSMQMCPSDPTTAGSQACPIYRGVLAVQPVTGDLFALTVDIHNNDQGLWRDVCNAGSSGCANPVVQFGQQIPDAALDTTISSGVIAQGSYDLTLAAVPSQQDTLLFAGTLDIFRCSLANSCTWRNTTNDGGCAAAMVAPAQHAFESSFGAQGLMYFGNDGGVWRTTDGVNQQSSPCTADDANHFQNLNGGLGSLAEVEDVAISSDNSGELLAALGALGTAGTGSAANTWPQVLNADGDQVAIDPDNDQNWFASAVDGQIDACNAGSACDAGLFQAAIGNSQTAGDLSLQSIPAPWFFDPASEANLLVGTCRVWRGPASGEGWSSADVLSTMLDGQQEATCNENVQNAEIRSLSSASAGQGAEQIYAGMAGVADGGGLVPGHLFAGNIPAAQQGAVAWTDMTESPVVNISGQTRFNPEGNDISSVYADPHDPSGRTVYATVQGYPSLYAGATTLYGSTDGGQQWSNLANNLPNAPANSVVVDPNDARIVYVATDVGVWVTTDISACANQGQACWQLMGTGLPLAPVTKLLTFNSGGTGLLVAATYGRGIWEIPLLTAGTESTTATATPGSLTFAPQPMQTTSAAQNVTVTVTGSLSLQVTGYEATGDFSVAEGACAGAMGLSSRCTLPVSFTPTAVGARSGVLSIYGNVPGGQLTVLLAGTGTGAAAVVLNPSRVSFGTALIGAATAAQDVTISNTGDAPATISTIAASGDFSIVANTCGTSLAAESGCTVAIAFAPSASGARAGALNVTDSAGTQSVPLSGTGQTPATDALAPATLSFTAQQVGTSSQAQTITLTNSGDSPLNLIAVTVSGDFGIVNDCGAVLVGHSACAILVTFAPSRVGAESGQVSITDALRTQTVALSGTGQAGPSISVAPDPLVFGGYGVGATTSPQMVTLTNNGGSAISGITASVTAGFGVASNSCTGTLAVGSACQFGVVFSPVMDGAASGTLQVQVGSSSQSYSVPVSGFGDDFTLAVAGATSQTITSGETATYALSVTPLSGTSGQVAFSCSGVPTGASCTLNPAQGTLSGQVALDATLTIVTGQAATSAVSESKGPLWPGVFCSLLPCAGIGLRRRRRRALGRVAGMLFLAACLGSMAVAGLSGCGVSASSGSSSSSGTSTGGGGQLTPSGSYPITVTASMPGLQKTVQVTLIVE